MSDPTTIPIRHVSELTSLNSSGIRGPIEPPSYNILVPIPGDADIDYDRFNIPRLLRTPLAVAADHDGTVTIANILTVPSDVDYDELKDTDGGSGIMNSVVRTAQEQVSFILDVTENPDEDITVNGFVGVVEVPEAAFVEFTTSEYYDAIYLAQYDSNRLHLWDEPMISSALDNTTSAVYVENIGSDTELRIEESDGQVVPDGHSSSEPITDILLAVGTGPHSVLAAETARALAHASGASVHALHLFPSTDDGTSRQKGKNALSLAEYVLSNLSTIESEARESEDIVAELLTEIEQYDVAIIGAPTKQPLLGRLFERSPSNELKSQSTTSVITVRQPKDAMKSVYYRWKRAVERTPGVDVSSDEEGTNV